MVVCRHFLHGTCKFGNNCKYEHYQTNNGTGTSIMRSRNSSSSVDLATLVKSVQTDMLNCEKGGQWLLSSYAPFKEKPIFPGFDEKLFEEVRYEFYEANMAGTVEQYKQQLQEMLLSAAQKVHALRTPNDQIAQTLYQIYNTPRRSTPAFAQPAAHQLPFAAPPPPVNIFASAAAAYTSPSNLPFASATNGSSPFNTQPAPAFCQMTSGGNIFGGGGGGGTSFFAQAARNFQPQQQPPPQYVAPQQQNIFGGGGGASMFGGTDSTSSLSSQTPSIFGGTQSSTSTMPTSTTQSTASIFGGASSTSSMMSQSTSIFGGGGGVAPSSTSSMVSQSSSIFAGSQPSQPAPSIFSGNSMQTSRNTSFAPAERSIFGGVPPASTATNIFAQAAQKMPIFAPAPTNIFGGHAAAFTSAASSASSKTNDCYSPSGRLPPEIIALYLADAFQFGRVPTMPPTVELCC